MRIQIFAVLTALSLSLTSCSSADNSAPSACDEAVAAADAQNKIFDDWLAKYPEYTGRDLSLGNYETWYTDVDENTYELAYDEYRTQVDPARKLWAQILVNHEECFDPTAIAELQGKGWRKGGTN